MPKLYSSSHVLKVLKKQGFVVTGGKGSHVKLKNKKLKKITVVPDKRKQIPLGTFFAILSQTGLSPDVFEPNYNNLSSLLVWRFVCGWG